MKTASVGLVLSGGGVRGIAHLGLLRVLEECGVKPHAISGTSAGALIGALFASGKSAIEILDLVKRARIFGLPRVGQTGLFAMKSFESAVLKSIPKNTFESLKIPLHVAVTDIVRGESLYFSQGILSEALMASACVPLLFPPRKHQGTLLVDGGILDNFPVQPLVGKTSVIVGSHVNALSKKLEHVHMKNILDRSCHFALSQSVYSKIAKCRIFFEPPEMSRFGMFDMKQADAIFQYSYEYASNFRTQLQELTLEHVE